MKEDAKKLAMKALRALGKEDLLYAHHGEIYARGEAYEKLAEFFERYATETENALEAKRAEASKQTAESIAKFLRTTPRAMGMLISVTSGQDIARLASEIEARTWPAEDA